ncbi:MAG: anthranilate phosphoribosyltransferase family protein [Elainellaceae cyanobacterium]
MSHVFRELLQKVGSGTHTHKDLTRAESAAATRMILQQEATPAQIGAFMIAHRIKRPNGDELAGILDAYEDLGPKLQPINSDRPVTILSNPYDGRSRTAPISPLTALILAAADCPVVMHGGDRMPTKYGVPLVELWQGLGVDWQRLSLEQSQQSLETIGIGFVYLPNHFPLAQQIVPYRDQIGKRPPFATAELFWAPYAGSAQIAVGYVHPPTEGMAQQTFALRSTPRFLTVKGLEGSCDLPRDRTGIVGVHRSAEEPIERLLLHPRDYGLDGTDVPLPPFSDLIASYQRVLAGEPSEMMRSVVWNGGFYLWQAGACSDLSAGLEVAATLLSEGTVADTLTRLTTQVQDMTQAPI